MKLEFVSATVKKLEVAPCLCCWQLELRPQEKEEETSAQRSPGFQGAASAGSEACARAAVRSHLWGSAP